MSVRAQTSRGEKTAARAKGVKRDEKGAEGQLASPVTVNDLRAKLRDAGLRSTSPRIAVLDFLHRTGTPNSHGELFDALGERGFDRATLYRNLMDLADAGLVTRTDLGDHVWRFELKRDGNAHSEDHPHFVCIDCGDIACLPEMSVKLEGSSSKVRAALRNKVSVQLKGRCDNCD
ncbi:MAG: transcriptional repressor [Polyangiaceae bacterium]|nr:transcriptional repressor [Polyangiaceae bacterium]